MRMTEWRCIKLHTHYDHHDRSPVTDRMAGDFSSALVLRQNARYGRAVCSLCIAKVRFTARAQDLAS